MYDSFGQPQGQLTEDRQTRSATQAPTRSARKVVGSVGTARRLLLRLVAIALLAGTALLSAPGAAHAVNFNPWPDSGVKTYAGALGNCNVKVGPVQDPYGGQAIGTYAVIGGVAVSCRTHHNLRAYVAEYYAPAGGTWRTVGTTREALSRNTLALVPTILQTDRICGRGGQLSGWFFTRAFVYETDITGRVLHGTHYDSVVKYTTAKALDAAGRC